MCVVFTSINVYENKKSSQNQVENSTYIKQNQGWARPLLLSAYSNFTDPRRNCDFGPHFTCFHTKNCMKLQHFRIVIKFNLFFSIWWNLFKVTPNSKTFLLDSKRLPPNFAVISISPAKHMENELTPCTSHYSLALYIIRALKTMDDK